MGAQIIEQQTEMKLVHKNEFLMFRVVGIAFIRES
jgi:hypothetical protein